jgi:UDP-N-acetyl-D-glucosamine dehydrogenase
MRKEVLIIGLGYVGLPIAVRAAEAGHHVIGLDLHQDKVDAVNAGHSYVEDVDSGTLARLVAAGELSARIAGRTRTPFEVALIAVPTPVDALKKPNLTYIVEAAKTLAQQMEGGETVILESTTYPGTTDTVVADAIKSVSGLVAGRDYRLGYSPERINPGDTVHTFKATPKIVSGIDQASLEAVQEFYDTLVDTTVPVSTPRTAELAKIFENTFANVNIALVNEMALICRELGIDVDEMLDAAATKGHNIMRYKPGLGTAGHCLPVDPLYLNWLRREHHGKPFKFAELADEVNNSMVGHAVNRVRDILAERRIPLWESRVMVLGVAYKPGVADIRESSSLILVDLLKASGAQVTALDPHVHSADDLDLAVKTAGDHDIVVVATAHEEFDYTGIRDGACAVLDCRNVYPRGAEKVHKL